MKKLGIMILAVSYCIFAVSQDCHAKRKNYYRTFEIINKSENSLTLQDNDGNIIEVDEDPEGYKIGYKVRYDSVRKRLRPYRWQDYTITEITGSGLILEHKTGDILTIEGNYKGKYEVGDSIRLDSVDNKLQADDDSGQWKQYKVVATSYDQITLRNNFGEEIVLYMNNNLYPERRGVFIAKYKVGDLVRYNVTANKLKKGVIRTYDWQDYEVKAVTPQKLILIDTDRNEITLDNSYGLKVNPGDPVKYDRLNNLLKKVR